MRILIATDAFPPVCGGSGWSTYELAKGLRGKGHDLFIVRPMVGGGATSKGVPAEYDGFRPIEFHAWAPAIPFARNFFKNERLYEHFEAFLAKVIQRHSIDIVHAQHVLTGPPSIMAARKLNVPAVCTVRDYWPVCYWSNLIRDRDSEALCPECTPGNMARCVRPRGGGLWPLALPLIPYMRANLSLKRKRLAAADAVIAVSRAIERDLRTRAPELSTTRIEMVPNPVDVAGIRAQAERGTRPMAGPYALFVGKLEPNKGVAKLLVALERSQLDWPVVVVGDGSQRPSLEETAKRSGRDVRFIGWRPREDVLVWLRHTELLIFPSHGPESLSRVLLEASVLGAPIAAMETGGTGDIIVNNETGLLSRSAEGLGDDVARLRSDSALRAKLSVAAKDRVERIFDTTVVASRIEHLYAELAGRK